MDGVHISQSMINTLGVALLGAGLTFIAAWFWWWRAAAARVTQARDAERDRMFERLAELEAKERVASLALTPIVTAFQALLVQKLTHAHKPELDALLVRIGPPDVLTDTERVRMLEMLEERYHEADDAIGQSERDAAKILPLVMPMALAEQRAMAEVGGLKGFRLMTVVSAIGE